MTGPRLTMKYGVYDHSNAAVFNDVEAYVFTDGGKWKPLNMADVMMNTGVISKEEFDTRFPKLPPLPKTAFRPPSAA